MDDLDRALKEWGRDWRTRQPTYDAKPYQRAATRYPWRPGVVLIAGVATIAVGLIFSSRPSPPSPQSGAQGNVGTLAVTIAPPDIIEQNDDVTASGNLVEQADGDILICSKLASLADEEPGEFPKCSTMAIPLFDVRPESVPGWERIGNLGFSKNVTVRGKWDGDGIRVTDVVRGLIGYQDVPDPQDPCSKVAGLRADEESPEVEAATGRLGTAVRAQPEDYGGLWRASSQGGRAIVVVGVAGDVEGAIAHLSPLYPFPMCFVIVEQSWADLESTVTDLHTLNATWPVEMEPSVNRVRVLLPVVDAPTWANLQPFAGRTILSPLVRPETSK